MSHELNIDCGKVSLQIFGETLILEVGEAVPGKPGTSNTFILFH